MPRSERIYVVEQYGPKTGNYYVVGAFTVKHEMETWVCKLDHKTLDRTRVITIKDVSPYGNEIISVRPARIFLSKD